MKSSVNTFPFTFTETFANGRPHRPGHPQRLCDWQYSCRRPMPTCNQVCYPGTPSRAHHGYGCSPFNPCRRAPYGGTSYDGCTRIHCNDYGCRVVDSYSYGGSCRCNNPYFNDSYACPGYPMPLGGGMTNLNNIQIDLNGRGYNDNGNGYRNNNG